MASAVDPTVAKDLENAKVNGEIPIITASFDNTSKGIDVASGSTRGTYIQIGSGPLPSCRMSREDSPQRVETIKSEYMIRHPPQRASLGVGMPQGTVAVVGVGMRMGKRFHPSVHWRGIRMGPVFLQSAEEPACLRADPHPRQSRQSG